jgi:HSP20 family protein
MAGRDLVRRQEQFPEKAGSKPTVAPAVDIYENNDEVLLLADFPGVSKDGVGVHLDKDVLTLQGTRSELDDKGLITSEFRNFDYHRAFTLPQGIDADRIGAVLENGVLRVTLPKSASIRSRRIEIKTS